MFFRKKFKRPFLSKDDGLWLFFSGHGLQHEGIDYILPIDGDLENPEDTGISLNEIAERLRRSGSENIVLIIDACRTEGRKGPALDSPSYNGITTIFSCKPNESSWEISEPIFQGAFTYVLVESLKQQVSGNFLTIADTEKLLQKELSLVNSKYSKPRQTPHIRCESATRSNAFLFSNSFLRDKRFLTEKPLMANQRNTISTKRRKDGSTIPLKKAAFDAEEAGKLELARRLWTQVLSADVAEHESYASAINRIAEGLLLQSLKSANQSAESKTKRRSTQEEGDDRHIREGSGRIVQLKGLPEVQSLEGLREYGYGYVALGSTNEDVEVFEEATYSLIEEVSAVEIDMVLVPGGNFCMGSSERKPSSSELPRHRVKVESFLMSKHPITKQQWKVVAQQPLVNRVIKLRPGLTGSKYHPVVEVSWYDAVEFCDRLTQTSGNRYRLPTEAEWEYACRSGSTTSFHCGNRINQEIAQFDSDELSRVCRFPYANAFGLHDMHGNVWEWCMDHWHSNYDGAPTDGSAWLDNTKDGDRIQRGGSWRNELKLCHSAYRVFDNPENKSNNIGFRIVRPL